jgi:hypothetical protein
MGSLGSAGCSLLRAEGFSCGLDVLYGGLFAFFDLKEEEKFSYNKFFSFWTSKPWILIHLKCWIRIRFNNTGFPQSCTSAPGTA